MKLLFTLILLVTVTTISAQTDLTEAQINTTITNNNAISGDIYHDTDNELYYMGVNSGGLRLMSDFKSVKISNELYFEGQQLYVCVYAKGGLRFYCYPLFFIGHQLRRKGYRKWYTTSFINKCSRTNIQLN